MNLLLIAVLLQLVVLAAVIVLLLRKSSAQPADPRLAELPGQLTRLEARSESLDAALRNGLGEIRRETAENAVANREATAREFIALRGEITPASLPWAPR